MKSTLNRRRITTRALALSAAIVLIPTAAFALGQKVYPTSPNGNGYQTATTRYGTGSGVVGAKVTGGYRASASGNWVYLSGQVDYDGMLCSDNTIGGYTPVTNQTGTYVGNTSNVIASAGLGCTTGAPRSRLCRDISGLPDPCGYWTDKY